LIGARAMPEAYILSAVRTPIGKFQGGLAGFSAMDLGAHVIKAAVARAGITPAFFVVPSRPASVIGKD